MSVPTFETPVARLREQVGSGPPIVARKLIDTIPFFGKVVEDIRSIGGKEQPFYHVHRDLGLWAVTAAFDTAGNLIVLPQLKYGVNEVTIELAPGGAGRMAEETPSDDQIIAQARGVFTEETGYDRGQWQYMGFINIDDQKMRDSSGQHGLRAHLLLATDLVKVGEPQPRNTEFYELVLIPPHEFPQLLGHKWLQEASAVACLYEAFRRLGYLQWNLSEA